MTYQRIGNINAVNGFGFEHTARNNARVHSDASADRRRTVGTEGKSRYTQMRAEKEALRKEAEMREIAALRARREADRRRAQYERDLRCVREYERAIRREHAETRRRAREYGQIRATAAAEAARRREEAELPKREIKAERRRISLPFIVALMIAFALLMGVVYSFSEVASASSQLSGAKSELSLLKEEEDKLSLKLEEKNDLSLIEKRATEELMMVSENSVQKKYISVSIGDRVVLDEDEIEESTGFFGSLMSSVSTAVDGLLDYFR